MTTKQKLEQLWQTWHRELRDLCELQNNVQLKKEHDARDAHIVSLEKHLFELRDVISHLIRESRS